MGFTHKRSVNLKSVSYFLNISNLPINLFEFSIRKVELDRHNQSGRMDSIFLLVVD